MRCFAKDCLIVDAPVTIGLLDRLRILVGFQVRVRTGTVTENRIGECDTYKAEVLLVKPTYLGEDDVVRRGEEIDQLIEQPINLDNARGNGPVSRTYEKDELTRQFERRSKIDSFEIQILRDGKRVIGTTINVAAVQDLEEFHGLTRAASIQTIFAALLNQPEAKKLLEGMGTEGNRNVPKCVG